MKDVFFVIYWAILVLSFIYSCIVTHKIILITPIFSFLTFNVLFIYPNYEIFGFDSSYFYITFAGFLSFIFGYFIVAHREYKFCYPSFGFYVSDLHIITMISILLFFTLLYWVYSYSSIGVPISDFISNPILYSGLKGKNNIAVDYVINGVVATSINYYLFSFLFKYESITVKRLLICIVLKVIALMFTFTTGRFIYISQCSIFIIFYLLSKEKKYTFGFQLSIIIFSFLVIPILLAILNLIRHGYWSELNEFSISDSFSNTAADLNPGLKLNDLINYVDLSGYNYGRYLLFIPLNIIPRFIWPDKPIISSQFDYTVKIYNLDPIEDITTYTFTLYDIYSAFGVFGMIVSMFVFGYIFHKIYSLVFTSYNLFIKMYCLTYILNAINAFRTNLTDSLFLTFMNFIIGLYIFRLLDFYYSKRVIIQND